MKRFVWSIGVLAAVVVLAPVRAMTAQGVTTAAVAGVVTDSSGAPLDGARVISVHRPSGTEYAAVTRADGRFTIPGMRVGGPYTVSVTVLGYRRQVQDQIQLTLGVTADLRFVLARASVELAPVTITATTNPVFSAERTGAATTIASTQIAHLPTITRRVEDLLRLTPQYSPMSFGFSFAGQDNRLNNMTIDGSYFNNSFGLAGQPGDRTGVAPVSLDALEQVQVNVAPYDVRQGNFVGAGINMVTKSGTNEFSGSLYYNGRNNSFVGTDAGSNTFNPGTFKYHDIGVALGGPIIRNRLFFFGSFENDGQTAPGTTFRANTGAPTDTVKGNVTRVLASDLDSLSRYLKNNFGYVTGPYQGYDFHVPSARFLARLDFNLNDRNKLNVRYTLLNSSSDILLPNSNSLGFGSRRGTLNSLNFANSNYAILENIRSVVGEWNSSIGSNMSNNLIAGYTSSDESRKNITPPWFPEVEILNGLTNYTTFGFEPFTPDNQLRYHSYQLQDNYTIYLPQHALTFGVSVEKYHSDNVCGEQNTQIRGGTGIFTGRPAYVWISNQIGNPGVLTGFLQADNTTAYPFNPNPDAYKPVTVTGAPAASFQLALTDPNFKFPQLWRSNFAVDQRLPWDLSGTAEFLYSKDVNGIAYINANLPAPQLQFSGPDRRPRWLPAAGGVNYNRIYQAVSNAVVLTNDGKGYSWNLAFSVERAFRSGWFAKLGYSYGVSRNTVDAGSIASGSWTGNAIALDPNNPVAAYSQFSPGPRVFGAVTYTREFFSGSPTSVSVYFDGRSAGNGSYVYSGDMNGDGASGNDLIYVPRNTSEMNFVPDTVRSGSNTTIYSPAQQMAAWEAFINQDSYLSSRRGTYAQRNAVFLPLVYRADMSFSQDVGRNIAGRPNRLQIRLDILNVTNLLDHNWGVSQGFVTTTPWITKVVDPIGAPRYVLSTQ